MDGEALMLRTVIDVHPEDVVLVVGSDFQGGVHYCHYTGGITTWVPFGQMCPQMLQH